MHRAHDNPGAGQAGPGAGMSPDMGQAGAAAANGPAQGVGGAGPGIPGGGMGMGPGMGPAMGPGMGPAADMAQQPGAYAPWGYAAAYAPQPPYPYGYGYYGMPPQAGGMGYAGPPPGSPGAAAAAGAGAGGLGAAMGNIADQAGLGMFKDLFNLDDGEFWKGALVGAAVVLLLTNENLREALVGGAAKTAAAMKSGLAGFGGAESAADGDNGEPAAQDQDTEPGQEENAK